MEKLEQKIKEAREKPKIYDFKGNVERKEKFKSNKEKFKKLARQKLEAIERQRIERQEEMRRE